MKRIGFFGGSFDPIHFGHLKMAEELMQLHQLDEVWFSPAYISPFKQETRPENANNRIAMLRLAIKDRSGFRVYKEEAQHPEPSYTIDTVKKIVKSKDAKFFLILSDESVPGFFHWKEAEQVVKQIPLLIGSRLGTKAPEEGSPIICEAMQRGWVPTEPLNISSTEIRQLLKDGGDCSLYVPGNVLDFIYENHLYSTS